MVKDLKLKIVENVYSEFNNEKTFKKLLRKIALKRPVTGLYVITEPLFEAGIMEIYNYNELLQPYYRKQKREISILGIATDRNNAKKLVCDILDDVYREQESPDIRHFFGIGG